MFPNFLSERCFSSVKISQTWSAKFSQILKLSCVNCKHSTNIIPLFIILIVDQKIYNVCHVVFPWRLYFSWLHYFGEYEVVTTRKWTNFKIQFGQIYRSIANYL